MAYLDIAAGDSYGRFSIKFASLVGLNTAVYWSALMNVLERVREKKTYDEQGFFTLNRSYIESKTTLTKDQQLECDQIMMQLGILDVSPDNTNKLRCDIKKFFSLVAEEDVTIINEIEKISKRATKEGKAEGKRLGIIHRLQDGIIETDAELLEAYKAWVEVCYDKGLVRKPQVDIFIETIRKYSSDRNTQLGIVRLATTLVYREAAWAISVWEKDHKPGTRLTEQKIATAVRTDVSF